MDNRKIKEEIIMALFKRGIYTKQVSEVEYRTRCPYCGDSVNSEHTGHMYIKIDLEDNSPIVWNCFRCNECGIMTDDVLSMLGIDDISIKSNLSAFNKTADRKGYMKYYNNIKTITFDYHLVDILKGSKVSYLEDRLGVSLSDDDLVNMKVITNFRDFLIENEIKELTCDDYIARRFEDHYIGFLSYGASHILFRDITNKEKYRWVKYPITKESKQTRAFYSMSSTVDIFTEDILTINLSEGILDIVSAYANLGYKNPNTMNIAVCGKRFDTMLRYLLNMGFVGKNVIVNIFADNDEKFNKKNNRPTTIDTFKNVLNGSKNLYGETNIYYNMINKDIGVPKDLISLKKYKL